MKFRFTVIMLVIFGVGSLVRVVELSRVPPGLSNDEISIAYDAYSLLFTGRDEHGRVMPVNFQSHNTYKAPLTAYLLTVTTAIFNTGETAARLPSAIFGSLTVLLFTLLVYRIFRLPDLALWSGGVLALTPVHIFTSHMVLESNIALFFVIGSLLLLFRFLDTGKSAGLAVAILFAALSVYGYHTEWVFTPLLIFSFWLVYRRYLGIQKTLIAGLLFCILLVPLGLDMLRHPGETTRASTQNLIYEPSLQSAINNPRISLIAKIHTLGNAVISNYANYFNPGYLFAYGLDIPPKPLTSQVGLFLAVYLPFFLVGLIKSLSLAVDRRRFLWLWLGIAPLVPALTKGGANFVRALVIVPPVAVFTGIGLNYIQGWLKPLWLKVAVMGTGVFIGFFYFSLLYYFHYPIHAGINFEYGYKQAAEYINDHPGEYNRYVVDPKFGPDYTLVGVPHLYLAYFTRYDPRQFLINRRDLPSGLYFSPYEIREINWTAEKLQAGTLYITPYSNRPPETKSGLVQVVEIDYPDKTPALVIYRSPAR